MYFCTEGNSERKNELIGLVGLCRRSTSNLTVGFVPGETLKRTDRAGGVLQFRLSKDVCFCTEGKSESTNEPMVCLTQ